MTQRLPDVVQSYTSKRKQKRRADGTPLFVGAEFTRRNSAAVVLAPLHSERYH